MVVFKARGIMPPVFTPLNEDQTVNYSVIPDYAKYLAKNGIKSVLVGGTTGENMSLSLNERKKISDAWVKEGKALNLHIMVQVGGGPMPDVLELARYCATTGVDSLLTLPELYFKPKTVDELVFYVELVATAAPNLPVLYYHIPRMTKVEINMPAFVTAATARIPNFKGLKFSSFDLNEGVLVKKALRDDQEMFLGTNTLIAPAALLDIKSSIGATYNLFPKLAQDILESVENNDLPQTRALQKKFFLATEALTPEGDWLLITKVGMEFISGIKMGPPALPQKSLSTEARNRIGERLRKLVFSNLGNKT